MNCDRIGQKRVFMNRGMKSNQRRAGGFSSFLKHVEDAVTMAASHNYWYSSTWRSSPYFNISCVWIFYWPGTLRVDFSYRSECVICWPCCLGVLLEWTGEHLTCRSGLLLITVRWSDTGCVRHRHHPGKTQAAASLSSSAVCLLRIHTSPITLPVWWADYSSDH